MEQLTSNIAITGFACITAAGNGTEPALTALLSGTSCLQPVPVELTGGRTACWGRSVQFKATEFIPPMKARKLDRASQLSVAATGLALADAGIARGAVAPERIGIAVGCGFGGIANSAEFLTGYFQSGVAGLAPLLFPNTVANAAASNASIEHGVKGPNITFIQRFCSAESAILAACRFIEEGRADLMLAGGVDDLTPLMMEGFTAMGQLNRSAAGFGEGAGMLVLEHAEHARQRGVTTRALLRSIRSIGMLLPQARQQGIDRLLQGEQQCDRLMVSGVEQAAAPLLEQIKAGTVQYPGHIIGQSLAMGATSLGLLVRQLQAGELGLQLSASPQGPYYAIWVQGGSPA